MSRQAIETEKSLAVTGILYQKNLIWGMSYNITWCAGGLCHLLLSVLILFYSAGDTWGKLGKNFQKYHAELSLREEIKPQKCAVHKIFHILLNSGPNPVHIFFELLDQTLGLKAEKFDFSISWLLTQMLWSLLFCMKFQKYYYLGHFLISVSMSLFPHLSYFSFMGNRP